MDDEEKTKQQLITELAALRRRIIDLETIETEFWRLEQTLRESEGRLRALVGSTDEIVFEFDAQGTILNIWTSDEKLLVKPKAEILGRRAADILGEEFTTPFLAAFKRVLTTGQAESLEYSLKVRAGDRWFLARISPIAPKEGGEPTLRLLARDITERKQAEVALARHAEAMTALYDTSLEINTQLEVSQLLEAIVRRAARLLGTSMGGFFLTQPDDQTLKLVVAHNQPEHYLGFSLQWGEGLAGRIALTGEPMMIANYRRWAGRVEALAQIPIARILGVPLKQGEHIIGVLTVCDGDRSGLFADEEVQLLRMFAAQAAVAVQNARLRDQVQQHAATLERHLAEHAFELRVLYELSLKIGYITNYEELCRLTLTSLHQVVPYEVAGVCLLTGERWETYLLPADPLSPDCRADLEARLLATLAELTGQPLGSEQVTMKALVAEVFEASKPSLKKIGSFYQVSLSSDQENMGLLCVSLGSDTPFTGERMRFTYTVANQVAQAVQRLRSLQATERRRLERLIAHLPDGVLLLDAEGHVLLANPAGRRMLAILSPEFETEPLTHLGFQELADILAHHTDRRPVEIIAGFPARRIFEVQARPATPAQNQWVLTLREVTQEREIQQQLEMHERLATVGQLAAGIAHDFNNILTGIIGFTTLVQMDPSISKSAKMDLDRVMAQGQRAANLIRQILDFSRQSIPERRPLDLVPFLKETIKLLERTIPENIRISLSIDPCPEAYVFNADPIQMQRALTNLAINARDAMPTGGRLECRLTMLTLEPGAVPPLSDMLPGQWLTLSVSDTGTGISPQHLPHIFEPFFTTKEVGEGSGLGLAQVYGIIRQHEGYIDVDSQVDRGTTFTLYLPHLPAAPTQPSPAPAMEDLPHGQGQTVMVVEDETAVLRVIQSLLERLGYQVMTAANGTAALEIFRQQGDKIAVLLTDITMPGMGGLTLAQTLRQQCTNLKVIAMTGYPLATQDQELLAEGVIDWLEKPLDLKQLAQAVWQALQG